MNTKNDPLRMKKNKLFAVITITTLALPGIVYGAEPPQPNRPVRWAEPIEMKGVPNLHKVSDALYRSGQPSAVGMRSIKAMGIWTVVDLRAFHSDRDAIGDTGLAYEHISMTAWHPQEDDAVRFLQIVTNPKRGPFLVHCQHGADRAGAMCALYRIAVQGWRKDEAIEEMTQGGFGFHGIWQNLIRWINALDVEGIKRKAGIREETQKKEDWAWIHYQSDAPGAARREALIRGSDE